MRRLRDSLSRPQHANGDPWDDGPLPDLTSGIMWSATGLLGAVVLWLPGSDRDHVPLALALAAFALAVAGAMVAIQFLKGRLVRAELHQRTMAERDPLTGVSNRRAFDAALDRAAATRDPYALILVDLDEFKRVNDEQGHPAGDEVLRGVGIAAAGVARRDDCVARIGGDEFAILAPGAGASGVLRLLRDLRDEIEHPATFAAGLVPDDATTPDELVAHVDARLLAQKRSGKQRQPTLNLLGRV